MPSNYQNSRRQVEGAIGLEAMRLVFFCGAHGTSRERCLEIKELFDHAIAEAAPSGTEQLRAKQQKRVMMLVQDVLVKPFVDSGEPASKFGLSIYYLLRNLLELGMIDFAEGSRAEAAIEAGLDALSVYTTSEFSAMDKSAFVAAEAMLLSLQNASYFRGAPWVLEFENLC